MAVLPRRVAALAILAGATFAAAPSLAREPATARLSYATAPGLERCPDEREVRDAIAARLGYDPFRSDAPREVAIHIGKRGAGGIEGALDVTGPRPGHREIASPGGDCREVADALAVAAAIAIDPESLNGPRPPDPPPAPDPSPAPPAPEPSRPEREPDRVPASDPVVGRIGVTPEMILGELPAVGVGAVVSGGARWRWLSGSIEGEATAAAQHLVEGGAVTASLLTAALVPCGHHGIGFVCVVGRAGVMRGEGEGVTRPARASEPYGALGARAGVEVPFPSSTTVSFLANAEVVAPLTRIALRLNGEDAWSVPAVAGRVAVGLGMRF